MTQKHESTLLGDNLRYADDNTLMAESEEELKSLVRVKEESGKAGLKLMSVESVMLSNHLILCCPLLLPPSVFPNIRVFSNESVLRIRLPKYWGFSFSISPSNEYSGLISFRSDWLDHLVVQGTFKSLL